MQKLLFFIIFMASAVASAQKLTLKSIDKSDVSGSLILYSNGTAFGICFDVKNLKKNQKYALFAYAEGDCSNFSEPVSGIFYGADGKPANANGDSFYKYVNPKIIVHFDTSKNGPVLCVGDEDTVYNDPNSMTSNLNGKVLVLEEINDHYEKKLAVACVSN